MVNCTWKTVTVAQSKESKFFLSLIPVSGSTNLHPNRFIPRILKYLRDFMVYFLCSDWPECLPEYEDKESQEAEEDCDVVHGFKHHNELSPQVGQEPH